MSRYPHSMSDPFNYPSNATYADRNIYPQVFQHSSTLDPSCSPGQVSSQLASPILPHTALANSLNPIQQGRIANCAPRALPYDYSSGTGNNQMPGLNRSGGRTGRRARDHESVDEDPEEVEKKMKRRQRNKEAAARCRQRRLDLMGNLNEQVQKLQNENNNKEREARQYQSQLTALTDYLESIDLPTDVLDKVRNITNSRSFNPNHCQIRNENRNMSLPNDYQPRCGNEHQLGQRRPISHGPRESDIALLEPQTKTPKLDSDPTLGIAVLSQPDDSLRVVRPNQLGLDTTPTTVGLGISTPSNFPQSTTFSHQQLNFGGDTGFPFLNQPTGLTPSNVQNIGFVTQTPTPLPTSSAELQMTNL
ncbi:unnamed protein product [Auanema sp. JU1783]|nr:unnamed protein product [Auanema sp. JU1783]